MCEGEGEERPSAGCAAPLRRAWRVSDLLVACSLRRRSKRASWHVGLVTGSSKFCIHPREWLVESDSESLEGRRARFSLLELPFFITFFYAKAEHFVLF